MRTRFQHKLVCSTHNWCGCCTRNSFGDGERELDGAELTIGLDGVEIELRAFICTDEVVASLAHMSGCTAGGMGFILICPG